MSTYLNSENYLLAYSARWCKCTTTQRAFRTKMTNFVLQIALVVLAKDLYYYVLKVILKRRDRVTFYNCACMTYLIFMLFKNLYLIEMKIDAYFIIV